jgi:hypothetical protein
MVRDGASAPPLHEAQLSRRREHIIRAERQNAATALAGPSYNQRRGQSSSDLAGFLVFLTGLLESSGLMLIGLPVLTGVAAASGSRKKARQGGLSCDLFWIMQTVMRSTSGTNAPQTRIASPLQACSCSGV